MYYTHNFIYLARHHKKRNIYYTSCCRKRRFSVFLLSAVRRHLLSTEVWHLKLLYLL